MRRGVDHLAARLEDVLTEQLSDWPVGRAGAAVVRTEGVVAVAGDDGPFPWASVTKLLTALTALDLARAGTVDLDDPGRSTPTAASRSPPRMSRGSRDTRSPPCCASASWTRWG